MKLALCTLWQETANAVERKSVMNKILLIGIAILLMFSSAYTAFAENGGPSGAALYVSKSGNDNWSGAIAEPSGNDGPFASIDRARDEARALKKAGKLNKGATIFICGGDYLIKETIQFTNEDSGYASAPIVYSAYDNETVRLIGGEKLDPSWFVPITDAATLERLPEIAKGKTLQVDLKSHGFTDYGVLRPRGFGQPTQFSAMELFFDGKPMQLARTPNKAWAKIASIPDGQTGARFAYTGDSPKQWKASDDIWVHGYWTYDWADSYVKVKSIDPATRIITTQEPYGVYGYSAGRRFRFENVFETLDSPGEWYLDRSSGTLYFWPPSPISSGDIIVSTLDGPIVSMKDVSNMMFRGLTIVATRGSAVEISGGKNNLIAGCVIRNTGNNGVNIRGGENNGVISSDIYDTGDGAIILEGGDRKTLTPAGNYAINNNLYRFGRWSRTYTPGVFVRGVGNKIEHNMIHDAPHVGILLNGNDHMIEYNDIHDINWETNDVGGFYLGRDWTERGNVVRYNFFHDIHAMMGGGAGIDSNSVYLDDCACGTTVYGNVFYKMNRAVFVGGGRDNIVENNVFVDANPGVLVDARCLGWASQTVVPGGTLYTRLIDMNYKQPPFSERYPELINILEDEPGAPKGNIIERNISIKGPFLKTQDNADKYITAKDNLVDVEPLFVDAAAMNFQLRDESPAFKIGFKRIPFDKIGLYIDEYRKHLPDRKY